MPEVATFRCSVASEQRADEVAGTATHVNAFLLVEHHGPWGDSVPQGSRLPDTVKEHLSGHRGLKVLMVRRHHRAHRDSEYRVFVCFPRRRQLLVSAFVDHEELCAIDVAAITRGEAPDWPAYDGPMFAVCTHGRHDTCCAERGRPVAAALSGSHPAQTWELSHMGGDRYAANMLVLPEGLYYGRMDPGTAGQVADLHLQGRVDIERLRGRSSQPMAVQYAEIALRRHLEEDRLDAIRLVRRDGDTQVFDHEGTSWSVTVRRSTREAAQLTCTAERLNPVPFFEVVALAPLQAP